MAAFNPSRNIVMRPADGKAVNVARFRGTLFVCANACCCGRTDLGNAPLDPDLYHAEWTARRMRNFVHLTVGGCLGPCALANVNLLLIDGQALWLHSMNTPGDVALLFDYIESLLESGTFRPLAEPLASHQFTASTWQPRPDGQPLDDARHWRGRALRPDPTPSCEAMEDPQPACEPPPAIVGEGPAAMLRAFDQAIAAPRKNGELVFAAPWEGRAFGMAAALVETGTFSWDEFREHLIVAIRHAESRPETFDYYACWLSAFEAILEACGIVLPADLQERTAEFEFGERYDIY